nr:paired-like homeodomain transcription factor LEUTX isoform X6 [Oryctolagus cuniculus]
MLKAVLETSRCPDWSQKEELSSELHLDAYGIKTWFKNQRAQQRKLQRKGQPRQPSESTPQPPPPPPLPPPLLLPLPPPPPPPPPPPTCLELSAPVEEEQGPGGCQAQGPEAAEDPMPADLHNIHLDSSAPWASLPHDIGELVRMYRLFHDDEPDD